MDSKEFFKSLDLSQYVDEKYNHITKTWSKVLKDSKLPALIETFGKFNNYSNNTLGYIDTIKLCNKDEIWAFEPYFNKLIQIAKVYHKSKIIYISHGYYPKHIYGLILRKYATFKNYKLK